MIKRFLLIITVLTLFTCNAFANAPMRINFQAKLATSEGGLIRNQYKKVTIGIYSNIKTGTTETKYARWEDAHDVSDVWFNDQGICNIVIGEGNKLTYQQWLDNIKDIEDPYIGITIDGIDDTAYVPFPSSPFSIQSKIAEEVLKIHADRIYGAFTNPVYMDNDLIVSKDVLVVDSREKRVGIGVEKPKYSLDVKGNVNAEGYYINGIDIESQLSWKRKSEAIYYTSGYVGIGTTSPTTDLDVAGTINAQEYLINGETLSSKFKSELAWQKGADFKFSDKTYTDIYYYLDEAKDREGFVGIGLTNPQEKLDVNGAIKIGAYNTMRGDAKPGTIQFYKEDFLGFTSGGWQSLTSLTGQGDPGQIAFWSQDSGISGSQALFWDNANSNLGIGTVTPSATLEIKASGNTDLFKITGENEDNILYVGYNSISNTFNVGIGTANPQEKLVVNGVIDASDFSINGVPIEKAISIGTYWSSWTEENNARLFYDEGRVGIGTTDPSNLLELASRHPSSNPALTFDIYGQDLFTLGIDYNNPEAFILGKGGDLTEPVFVFKGKKIGIGILNPQANLHVSGNNGVIFNGEFIEDADMTDDDRYVENGAGSKLIWYPAKAVFRAGSVTGQHWDEHNLGDYSVAMGSDSIASGNYSFVGGGLNNRAYAEGAVAPGGIANEAIGRYSFAAGHKARAEHSSSFVWADYTPDLNHFTSMWPSQFIIRANNGVGIGTTDTKGSVLTLARNTYNELLFRAVDGKGDPAMVISTSGNVGIGTDRPKNAKLAVMNGKVGIGTTDPDATLTVVNQGADEIIFIVLPKDGGVTAGILVNSNGQVGVGVSASYVFDPATRLKVNGGIKASEFKVVDPNDPNGEIILQPNPGSPWADPSSNDNNTHRSQGLVGIGTTDPNSLLELSNGNQKGSLPVITFDINQNDIFSIGPTLNADSTGYLFTFQTGGDLSSTPSIAISTNSVGIGTHLTRPEETLHVSGNTFFEGSLVVGSPFYTQSIYDLVVNGAINVDELYIKGDLFVPKETPWQTSGLNIFYTSGNVGIGTSTPSERLDVVGTILTDTLSLTNKIKLNDGAYLITDKLELRDIDPAVSTPGLLYVDDNALFWKGPDDNTTKKLSSPLQRGEGNEGNLAFWVDKSSLGESTVYWKETDRELTISGNLSVSRNFTADSGFIITSNINMGAPTALSLGANLSYIANPNSVRSFTGEDIYISIDKNWGHPSEIVQIKGLDISMESKDGSYLYSDAEAIGLYIDVSDVNIVSGRKYAAIFKGGDDNNKGIVGIGIDNPTAELEVAGTVSANYFNLSGGLTVPQLVVNDGSFIAIASDSKLSGSEYIPRIAINFQFDGDWESLSKEERQAALTLQLAQTDAELLVNGTISANIFNITGGLAATTINIQNNTLVVDATGNIGIGTSEPNGQIELRKIVQTQNDIDADFYSEKIYINVDGAGEDNSGLQFSLDKNLTGMDISVVSEENNTIVGDVNGIKVDISEINLQTNSYATGLEVNVMDTLNSGGTRYAAVFRGGRVGIGTNTPDAELEVSGNILATNLTLDGTLAAETAEFNFLTVNNTASLNGTVTVNNDLIVLGTATINHLVLNNTLESAEGTFETINATIASINGLLETNSLFVASTLNSTEAYFDKVGIARPIDNNYALSISGNIHANELIITEALEITSSTLNINNGNLFVGPYSDKVGIGTTVPDSILHINTSQPDYTTFRPEDNRTWNGIHIQTQGTYRNLSAGIILVPDASTPSKSIGSGIIAIRNNQDASNPGSHLVFVTDPSNGDPAEHMRLTSEGRLGIGTDSPSAQLEIQGSARFDGVVTVNGALVVDTISGINGVTINPDGNLKVEATSYFDSDIMIDNALYLKKGQVISSTSDYAILYSGSSDPDDNSLYYLKPDSNVPINISAPFIGTPLRIPYFNIGGSLEDNANLFWDPDTNIFQIGTSNVNTSMALMTTINSTTKGNVSLQKIHMGFKDRSALLTADSGRFTGLEIEFTSDMVNNPTEFGRLADGETAVGLKVDVSNLRTKYFNNESLLKGNKYAALFLGGAVGIGTSTPEAALHIASEELGLTPFRVDTRDTLGEHFNALMVSSNSFIGIGVTNPQSRLVVKSDSASDSPLEILDSTGTTPIVYVNPNNNYIGIGTRTPQTQLEVNGTISSNISYFGGINAITMNIGQGAFFVNASGNIGIGTTDPSGNLSFYKSISKDTVLPEDTQYVAHKLDLILSGGTDVNTFHFKKNLVGLDIKIQSNANTRLGNADVSYNATGINIDMTDLLLESQYNASAVGLFVDLTNNNLVSETGGNRYAAIFQGGHVGIGTATPSVELDVSGNIHAQGLYLSGKLEAYEATFNSISVTGIASINQSLTINNRLYANSVSANNIILSGTLSASTASVTLLEADIASFNKVVIGANPSVVTDPDTSLYVSGNTDINGDMEISGILSVSTINSFVSPGGITINIQPNSKMYVGGGLDVNGDLILGKSLYIKETTPNTGVPEGQLYVNETGELRYARPNDGGDANLSALFGTAGKIPHYALSGPDAGNLVDTAHLNWDQTILGSGTVINEFKVGTNNALTSMKVISNIQEQVTGDISAQDINMTFGNRTSATEATVFSGLKIKLESFIPEVNPENDFGRVAENETAIGLKVDVSNLAARYQSQAADGGQYQGFKYAGLFLGGNVGIGTTAPESALHVVSEIADTMVFRIDTQLPYAFTVSSNSFVGIGTSDPVAQLTVKSNSYESQNSIFEIVNNTGATSLFSVKNDGKIGIGTNTPSANLHILSDDQPFTAGTTAVPHALVVTADGLVGIGTPAPVALFHTLLSASYADSVPAMKIGIENVEANAFVIASDGKAGIGMDNPPYSLSIDGFAYSGVSENLTGLPSWLSNSDTDTKGLLVSNGNTHSFFGLRLNDESNHDTVFHWGQNDTDAIYFEHFSKAYEIYPDKVRKVMTLKGNGTVGIGTTEPSANLTVSGDFKVSIGNEVALIVSSNGWVGINTAEPKTTLDVDGDLMTNTLTVQNGGVEVSTLDLKGTLKVYKEANDTDIESIGQIIQLSITQDVQVPVTGLDITLKSEWFDTDQRGYALWGSGVAYGLKVDINTLTVGAADLNNSFAQKYAGVFLGGYVGIGTQIPKAALHVQAATESDIAKFGSVEGNVTFHDYGSGMIGFYNVDAENDTTYHHTLMLSPGLSTEAGNVRGKVGIGIVNPDARTLDKTLVVNGDMRLGIVRDAAAGAGDSYYGNKLWFSGAPDIDSGYNASTGSPYTNENRDDVWMARYNREVDQSELHVNIGSQPLGELNSPDRFVVGYTPGAGAAFKRIFQVVSDGKVGIQDGVFDDTDVASFPKTVLHVRGQVAGPSTELQNHVVLMENNNTTQADTLAIYHSFGSNQALVPTRSHFITFFMGATPREMGSIEGNNLGSEQAGVRFKTSAADYAEYLPKLDPNEDISEGDIVGVFNGKITKHTKDAQQIMVISTAAGVAGNFPGNDKEHLYGLVSFFGQAPVKVIGTVNIGDYIIPSGQNNGLGIAVSPNDIKFENLTIILGRAWESSELKIEKPINVAVGFNFSLPSLKKEMNAINELKEDLKNLKAERKTIIQDFDSKLKEQNKELELLLKAVSKNSK
jgi:hypothetical protein